MPCIVVQNIGIISNQPIQYQPYTSYTNNAAPDHNKTGGIPRNNQEFPQSTMQGLTDNIMRWSLDQPPEANQGSFKSHDMRPVSMSVFLKQDKDVQVMENRGSDHSMFSFLKSDSSNHLSGMLGGAGRNSRGSNEFNPKIIMSNSNKSSIENQNSFGIV